jgi:hypothetical protein
MGLLIQMVLVAPAVLMNLLYLLYLLHRLAQTVLVALVVLVVLVEGEIYLMTLFSLIHSI